MAILTRQIGTAWKRCGRGYTAVRVLARYPEAKAIRIMLPGGEMICRESEVLEKRPETEAEARRRRYNEGLRDLFKETLTTPKTISEIAKERGAWPIQIAAWLLKLQRFSWVKRVEGNKWEWKGV